MRRTSSRRRITGTSRRWPPGAHDGRIVAGSTTRASRSS
jgi:hypothetical protein